MKKGVEYLHSEQKERFDQAVATMLSPAYLAARLGAKAAFGFSLYTDERVGKAGEVLTIPKIRTLDDTGMPLSNLAETFRQKGLDELPQLALVREGAMSIVGTRHLLPDEDEELRRHAKTTIRGRQLLARHDDIVLPAKRGILSTFAIHAHIFGPAPIEQRLALNIHDHENASLANDIRIILRATKSTALNELKNGSNHIHAPIAAKQSAETTH